MAKVADISHVSFRCRDLDVIERFLTDFGLVRAHRTAHTLYMRGTGPAAYCYVAEKADQPGFAGLALRVDSRVEFDSAAHLSGASTPQPLSGPGGGMSVTVHDPDGFPVHVVYGIESSRPLPMREALPINHAGKKHRHGQPQRIAKGPAQVLRLGHVLLFVSDFERTKDWYCSNFGMLPSDYIHEGTETNRLGGFLRCDRGEGWTDHHTIAIFKAPKAKFHHASFEVQDFDAQYRGHEWLRERNYEHLWGIGRHLLGSQIFDYWYDPYGNIVEHFTDGDLFRREKPAETYPAGPGSLYQWGPEVPQAFFA